MPSRGLCTGSSVACTGAPLPHQDPVAPLHPYPGSLSPPWLPGHASSFGLWTLTHTCPCLSTYLADTLSSSSRNLPISVLGKPPAPRLSTPTPARIPG